jgi:hypothetical protein
MLRKDRNATRLNTDDLNAFIEEIIIRVNGCSLIEAGSLKNFNEHARNRIDVAGIYKPTYAREFIGNTELKDHSYLSVRPTSYFVKGADKYYHREGTLSAIQIVKPEHMFDSAVEYLAAQRTVETDEGTIEYCFVPGRVKFELYHRIVRSLPYVRMCKNAAVMHKVRFFGYETCVLHLVNHSVFQERDDEVQEHDGFKITSHFIESLPNIRIMPKPEGKAKKGGITLRGNLFTNLRENHYFGERTLEYLGRVNSGTKKIERYLRRSDELAHLREEVHEQQQIVERLLAEFAKVQLVNKQLQLKMKMETETEKETEEQTND